MDTNERDRFGEWLAAETAKAKELTHSPEMWTRKNADNRLDALLAAAKLWEEFKQIGAR